MSKEWLRLVAELAPAKTLKSYKKDRIPGVAIRKHCSPYFPLSPPAAVLCSVYSVVTTAERDAFPG